MWSVGCFICKEDSYAEIVLNIKMPTYRKIGFFAILVYKSGLEFRYISLKKTILRTTQTTYYMNAVMRNGTECAPVIDWRNPMTHRTAE